MRMRSMGVCEWMKRPLWALYIPNAHDKRSKPVVCIAHCNSIETVFLLFLVSYSALLLSFCFSLHFVLNYEIFSAIGESELLLHTNTSAKAEPIHENALL